ncbi:MAG: nitrite/sulfite reductase [Cellulosilyticaceae bacterium]
MVQLSETVRETLREEIEQFRQEGQSFLRGEMNKMTFKKKSGGMGVYAQRDGRQFMVRLRIPCGVMTKVMLERVYHMAQKYGLKTIHLTTRQAIQFHDLTIDEVCDVMQEALELGIYTRGSGGNFPRNIAISPLAGVDPYEAFDVLPYAMVANQYFMEHMTTYKLPRKLKVAFSSNEADYAHGTMQDMGFVACCDEDGQTYFKLYIGGGLGQNPELGMLYPEKVRPEETLAYLEAMVRLFVAEGDYENRSRARVRYIKVRMGEEAFALCFKKHLEAVQKEATLPELQIARGEGGQSNLPNSSVQSRILPQRQKGYYSVSIHPRGGQLGIEDLCKIITHIEQATKAEIRLGMEECLYVIHLTEEEAQELAEITADFSGETPLEYSVACIGVPTCQIGIVESQELLKSIQAYFEEHIDYQRVLPRIHISGCTNCCGMHLMSAIGFAGKKKKIGEAVCDVVGCYLDGHIGSGESRLGRYFGDAQVQHVPQLLEAMAEAAIQKGETVREWVSGEEEQIKCVMAPYIV